MEHNQILVTGATGTIGQELIRTLRSQGASVTAGIRTGAAAEGIPGRAVDFNDPVSLRAAFAGMDTVFLLFPLVPNKLALARNAVEAAREAGVKHLVRSSGAGADPQAAYAIGRLQGEIDALVMASGIPYTLVRPSSFMQNFITFYGGMIRGGSVYLPHGEGKTSFVDARDIAAVSAEVLANPSVHAGKIYTITGSAALGTQEALDVIGRAIGRDIRYVPVDETAAQQGMRENGLDPWTIDILTSLDRAVAAGHTAGMTDTVKVVTGKEPRTFEEFANDHAKAWQ